MIGGVIFRTLIFTTLLSLVSAQQANAFAGPTPSGDQTLRILTLNTAQLPFPLGLENRDERVKELGRLILAMENQPDVICFQEMFRKEGKERITKELHNRYPFFAADDTDPTVGVNSGLLIVSKFPIAQQFSHTYNLYRGIEDFAAKGVLGAQIPWKGRNLLVFTTHLQTGGEWDLLKPMDWSKPDSTTVKVFQVYEAQDFIGSLRQSIPNSLVLFAGDFNIRAGGDLYLEAARLLMGARDAHSEACSVTGGTVWEEDGISVKPNRIDYIWVFGSALKGNSCITNLFNTQVTDHLGVVAELTLSE